MTEAQSILAAALRLPAEERAAVVGELLQSLEGTDEPIEQVEAAWADEVKRRLAEVDRGDVKPIPWSEARRRIFAAANGKHRVG